MIREKTGADMVEAIRSQGAADLPTAEKTEKVSVMDISGEIASAKLVTWLDRLPDPRKIQRPLENAIRCSAH